MEKWVDKKDLVFPYLCLVGGVEKWRDGKPFQFGWNKKYEDEK